MSLLIFDMIDPQMNKQLYENDLLTLYNSYKFNIFLKIINKLNFII